MSLFVSKPAIEVSDQIRNKLAGAATEMSRCLKFQICRQLRISIEPRHEKTGFLHMRKQRRRSDSR